MHFVLLGDSTFDNAAYVPGGPDVVAQLRARLPAGDTATLRAVDGATTQGVALQLARLPGDATHLVLSVGGNDALGHIGILEARAQSFPQVLGHLADIAGAFERRYRQVVDAVCAPGLPVTVCTVYNGNLGDALTQRLASTALTVFNDAILRVAFERALGVIDLRLVCREPADYANPIEPSVRGGAKIARAVARAVGAADAAGAAAHASVYAG